MPITLQNGVLTFCRIRNALILSHRDQANHRQRRTSDRKSLPDQNSEVSLSRLPSDV
mgnify:FL=1